MHCVTIKKPSFHALMHPDVLTGSHAIFDTFYKYGRVKRLRTKYTLQRNKSYHYIFTVRLIALNKNIEL